MQNTTLKSLHIEIKFHPHNNPMTSDIFHIKKKTLWNTSDKHQGINCYRVEKPEFTHRQ